MFVELTELAFLNVKNGIPCPMLLHYLWEFLFPQLTSESVPVPYKFIRMQDYGGKIMFDMTLGKILFYWQTPRKQVVAR